MTISEQMRFSSSLASKAMTSSSALSLGSSSDDKKMPIGGHRSDAKLNMPINNESLPLSGINPFCASSSADNW